MSRDHRDGLARPAAGDRRTALVSALLFGTLVAAAAGQGRTDGGRPPRELPSAAPTLEEVFSDIGVLLRRADRGHLEGLKVRLRETDDELRLLENLKAALDRGVLVDLPPLFREPPGADASPEALIREQQGLDQLQADVRLAEARRQRRGAESLRPPPGNQDRPSALAQAAIEVQLEILPPPKGPGGTPAAAAAALDQEGLGKALYLAKDYSGALNALQAVPAERRSLEVRCIIARCFERTGRWTDAREIYTAVAAEDPNGPWGSMAQWMLRFGDHLRSVRDMLGRTAPGGEKGR